MKIDFDTSVGSLQKVRINCAKCNIYYEYTPEELIELGKKYIFRHILHKGGCIDKFGGTAKY